LHIPSTFEHSLFLHITDIDTSFLKTVTGKEKNKGKVHRRTLWSFPDLCEREFTGKVPELRSMGRYPIHFFSAKFIRRERKKVTEGGNTLLH